MGAGRIYTAHDGRLPHFERCTSDGVQDLLRAAPDEDEAALQTYVLAWLDHWSSTAPFLRVVICRP